MKLLLINYEFPPLGGGAGNATQNIARELVKAGHSVLVLTTWFRGLEEEEVVDGYAVVRIRSRRKRVDQSNVFEMLSFIWAAIKASKKIIRNFKPDHTISFFAIPSGIVACYLKYIYKLPYTISLRGGDVPGFLPKNLKWMHFFSAPITHIVWKKASYIVANSKSLQELAQKTANRFNKNVVYIPNGVDTAIFIPSTEKTSIRILFVGRLVEQKGVTYLLHALHELKSEGTFITHKVQCDIVGDGPLRASLEQEARDLGVDSDTIFHGWITRDQLPQLYKRAYIMVLPSFEEGMPNVLLEALAAGLPIVATDIGGTNELVANQKNGFLYKDHADLAPLLRRIILDQNLAQAMSNASLEISKKFDWDFVAEGYMSLID